MSDKQDKKKLECKVNEDGKITCVGEYTGPKGELLECKIDYSKDGHAISVAGDEECIRKLHPTAREMIGKDKTEPNED